MTRHYTLIGERLNYSLSKFIHEAFYRLMKRDAVYHLTEIAPDALADTMTGLRLNYAGVNVTIPYKVDIIPFLDDITPEAQRIGAVNTIEKQKGVWIGHNTDTAGFTAMLAYHGFTVKGRRCAILGTGGAAKAAEDAVRKMGAASVAVFSRTPEAHPGTFPYAALTEGGDLLINCTPVGMYPSCDACPIPAAVTARFDAAVDMIYNPRETVLTRHMKAGGRKAETGLFMLVKQAALAQEIWFGQPIEDQAVEYIYRRILEESHP